MSTKKEHRIPITVSRMMRILEGKQDSSNSGNEAVRVAAVQSKEKEEKPKTRSKMRIESVDDERSESHHVYRPNTPKKADSHHHVKARVHHHVHHHERANSFYRAERAVPIVHTHIPVQVSIPVVPIKPILVDGIDMTRLRVAYFCMEIGMTSEIPFYSGGLGVLAGDTLKSCADLGVPVVGVSLLYRKGFFKQSFDQSGWQIEEEDGAHPERYMIRLREKVSLVLEGRTIVVRAWMSKLSGQNGKQNPIIFLDTDTDENSPEDRSITHQLYAGDRRHRLLQEAILGIGGVKILEALGASRLEKFHMNEGHASLLTVELFRRFIGADDPVSLVHRYAVFTTHTPIAAGHDRFQMSLVDQILGNGYIPEMLRDRVIERDELNMTKLGFELSGHINGVAKRHGDVTREMFPGYVIDSITNGVYAKDWVSPHLKSLYRTYLPSWETDPYSLRYALSIPHHELLEAHGTAKQELLDKVKEWTGVNMRTDVFTIGFARRATSYKRAELMFSDVERLKRIAQRSGKGIQIIFAGKAHPHDHEGKLMMQRIINLLPTLGPNITACYIPNYNIDIAKFLVAGVDLWVNTPRRPQEASGTSGMKAALNGVPQLSVLDGWWIEGHIEHVTGWAIGPHPEHAQHVTDQEDAESLYTKLEYLIIPKYYDEPDAWAKIMRHTIAINGSFFNTHRMVEQYVLSTYFK